jgi:hypothetical protein
MSLTLTDRLVLFEEAFPRLGSPSLLRFSAQARSASIASNLPFIVDAEVDDD